MILTSSWPHARVSRVRGTRADTKSVACAGAALSVSASARWGGEGGWVPTPVENLRRARIGPYSRGRAPEQLPKTLPDPIFSKVTPKNHPAARSRPISLSIWHPYRPKIKRVARVSCFFAKDYTVLRFSGGLVRGLNRQRIYRKYFLECDPNCHQGANLTFFRSPAARRRFREGLSGIVHSRRKIDENR